MSSITKDFTKGNTAKNLLLFTLPFMASNALLVLYSTIDMMIVGNFVGTAGLSAVSLSSLVINFASMVCLGYSNAGQVLVAQALGAEKKDRLSKITGTLFTLLAIFSLILSAIILGFKDIILDLVNVPIEAEAMAEDYLVICGIGLIFNSGYNMVSAVLRGMGDSKRPLLFIFIASVINLVLDILFTGFLGFGVAGAAWATVIGQAASFIFSLYFLYKNRKAFGFEFSKEDFLLDKTYSKMIVSLGTPMAIQSGFINLSMLYVNSMINAVGVVESATFGVGCRIDDIVNKISQGIQYAAVPMISQNIAAGNKKKAKEVVYYALLYSVIMTVFFMTLYVVFGKELFMAFSDDTAVHGMSETFIQAILWMFPAFALMRGSGAFIQGIGNANLAMVLALLDGVVLRIGLSWLFGIALGFGFYGFVLGYALAPYGYAIPSMIYFIQGGWEKRKVLADDI